MVKVITYGTYDMLHYGHIRLLERAKALGDYLIVGVTSDDYDKTRGKINNQQSLMERVLAVKSTGIADEVIVEEYEGQKIDDIRKYGIDIFTVGSDWEGKFDYLNNYCKVVYLPRTEGISSTQIRSDKNRIKIGIIGEELSELTSMTKFLHEVEYVNGVEVACSNVPIETIPTETDITKLVEVVDAVYIATHPSHHYQDCKAALLAGKHVLCESPIALKTNEYEELVSLSTEKNLVLMDGIKTAYTTAYERLLLISKSGKIGDLISVDSVCTSLKQLSNYTRKDFEINWNTITEWGPPALLPVFQLLGTDYQELHMTSKIRDYESLFDDFTKIEFRYRSAVGSIKVAKGMKSEGELVISGTKGYILVPSPWWKTDYFEVRYENATDNKRYFYQLDGEGIRYEIVAFARAIENRGGIMMVDHMVSKGIVEMMEIFHQKKSVSYI